MRLLFVAFAISFCALLWVAFSVARHILRHEPQGANGTEASLDGAKLPTAAAKGITSRPEARRP
jgi:hypothetical protein